MHISFLCQMANSVSTSVLYFNALFCSRLIKVLTVKLFLSKVYFGWPLFLLSPAVHLRAILDSFFTDHVTGLSHLRLTRAIPISFCSIGFKRKSKVVLICERICVGKKSDTSKFVGGMNESLHKVSASSI